jgi:hypothetical protein
MPQTPQGYGSSSGSGSGFTSGLTAGNTPNWSNQQLSLANQTYTNLSNYVRQSNIGSKNLSGMGFSAIGRPQIAGQ